MNTIEKSPLEKIINRWSAGQKQSPGPATSADQPQLPPAEICSTCHGGLFWLDAYDNMHCGVCEPPPRPSFVREVLLLVRPMWLGASDPTNPASHDGVGFEWRTMKQLRRATQQAAGGDDTEDIHKEPTEERTPDGLASIVTFERGYRSGPQAGEGFGEWWSRQRDWK